jgi:hypothetical protein
MDEYRLFGGFLSVTDRAKAEGVEAPVDVALEEPAVTLAGGGRGDSKE